MLFRNITIVRGDTYQQAIEILSGDPTSAEKYTLATGDKLYVGIHEPHQRFEDSIIRKVYTKDSEKTDDGDIIFTLHPTDTEYLHPGTYYLCAKLLQPATNDTAYDTVSTVVPDTIVYLVG